jgi:hypothetical protein
MRVFGAYDPASRGRQDERPQTCCDGHRREQGDWIVHLADILDTHSIPPEKAAHLAVELASGRFDALTGRVFYATEDLDETEAKIASILEGDGRRLVIS